MRQRRCGEHLHARAGHQWPEYEAPSDLHATQSVAISVQSVSISVHQCPSVSISGNQWQSVAISGNQW